MKNTTQLSLLFGVLLLGGAIGYFIAESKDHDVAKYSMEEMMHSMTGDLDYTEGDEFDKVFLEDMIVHHQGAIDMANRALVKSNREEILNLSREIIDAQQIEINQMIKWKESWFE